MFGHKHLGVGVVIVDVPKDIAISDEYGLPDFERLVAKGNIYETPHYLKIRDQDGAHHFFKHEDVAQIHVFPNEEAMESTLMHAELNSYGGQ